MPQIPEHQTTPLVEKLLGIIAKQSEQIAKQSEQIQMLKDEIAILKKQKPKPKIKPSNLNKPKKNAKKVDKRPGSEKLSKKNSIEIHETITIRPENIPLGSIFNGTRTFDVQDIVIRNHNTRYKLEEWITPDGKCITGSLPGDLNCGHFGPELVCFILYQYHQCHVTEPLLFEELLEFDN